MRRAIACLCALALLVGCARAGAPRDSARLDRGELIVGQAFEPTSLNPLLVPGGSEAMMLGSLLYSYLVTDNGRGQLVPDAATVVPTVANGGISHDHLTVTYHLRHGIRWQDGKPLTSRDCAFTFRAIMNPRNDVPTRYDYIADVTTPDDYTVVVHLTRPYAPIVATFLALDGNYPILPAHLLSRYPDINNVPFDALPVGSGPFRVTRWARGDRLEMTANPTYFRGVPGLRRIVMVFVADNQSLVNGLRSGAIDAVPFAFASLYDELASIPDKRITRFPMSGIFSIALNTQSGPTADVAVRRAIARAIDVPSIVESASHNAYVSKDAMRGLFSWAYRPIGPPPPYDPQAARRILDAAGWHVGPNGIRSKNGTPLSLSFAFTPASPDAASIATMVQQELHNVGMDVEIRSYSASLYSAPAAAGGTLLGGKFSLAIFAPGGGSDPNTGSYYLCSQRAPIGFNVYRLCDPRIDALENSDMQSFDPAQRVRYAVAIERLLRQDIPEIVLGQIVRVSVFPTNMAGFSPTPTTEYANAWQWRIDR